MQVRSANSAHEHATTNPSTRRLPMMEKKKVRDLSLYHSTMALMRTLLARGVITPEEYGVIDTKMAEKYGLKSSVIFR
jgi:hypothetical protein